MEDASKPLLLMDVDGVLNPYPDCPDGYIEYEFFPEDTEPVRLHHSHGEWLRELAKHFTIAWLSGWGEDANRLLSPHFGLPPLPVILLPHTPLEPSAKVPAVHAYVGDRPVAWVDDIVTMEAQQWAENRPQPTLLMKVDHAIGLSRSDVDDLIRWARVSAKR